MTSTPQLTASSAALRKELAALAARYHAAGWMLGTSGNLSARVTHDRLVVTASGCDKGRLTEEDFVEVGLDDVVLAAGPGRRPSAETSIHIAVYRRCPEVQAVLHVHTPDSSLLAKGPESPSYYDFTGFEMVKGWGLWEPDSRAHLALFDNHPDVPQIAADVERWLDPTRAVPALVIERHGITAWGVDLVAAHRHLEVTEFLCRVAREAEAKGSSLRV